MPRTKGLLEYEPPEVNDGRAYQVALRPQVDQSDEQMGAKYSEDMHALEHGAAVITNSYREVMRRAVRHEVFVDKVIDSKRSAHEVAFGRMVGNRNGGGGRLGSLFSVAMKPFGDAMTALHEMYGYEVLQKIGVETFEPIGTFPSATQESYVVVTKKRNDLMSLDRDDWIVGRQVHSEVDAEIAQRNNRTVADIAKLMAYMHNGSYQTEGQTHAVFHPDGQIKNFAVTPRGEVGVIDTENLRVMPVGDPDSASYAWENIEKLVQSLIMPPDQDEKIFGVGMFAGMSLNDVRKSCDELVIRPYVDSLATFADQSDHPDHGYQIAAQVCTLFYDDPTWPGHLIPS